MHVDWAALGIVAVVSIAASVIFTILLASGIRLVSAAKIKSNEGGSGTATVSLGYVLDRHRRAARTLRDLPDRSAVPLADLSRPVSGSPCARRALDLNNPE